MIKYMVSITLLLNLFFSPIAAQQLEFPATFQTLLQQAGIGFVMPLEAKYKDFSSHFNEYANYDFRIRSRKEHLEIRYAIHPYDEHNVLSMNPHLLTMRAVASVASNDEDYFITAIEMEQIALKKDFNADWGITYFFTPKDKFSDRPYCRLIALYKEGKGTAFVYYLFKDTKNEALDKRYLSLFFEDTIK